MNTKYIDRYDKNKNYVKLLAVPGRPYQSREVIEVQTQLYDHIERIARTHLKDGIIQGCDYIDNGTNTIGISPGKIFIGGLILENPKTIALTITKRGKETIGVKIVEEIVTANEDNTLRDPAAGYENYMNEGCDRLKYTLNFVVNDPTSLTLYSLIDGKIEKQEEVVHDNFTDTLARRTYDESGNYRIRGLSVIGRNEGEGDLITMSLESGKAYIKGYEVEKPASTIFRLTKSKGSMSIIGEPHRAYGTSSHKFTLITPYVKEVKRVVVEETVSSTITRGQIVGGTDYLPKTPVVDIVSITDKEIDPQITYQRGRDWNLTENGISWEPSGSEPSLGSSYFVKWLVNTEISSTKISTQEQNNTTEVTISGISINQGSQIQVDYDCYLARKDLVCLDSKGNLIITEGQPNTLQSVEVPSNTDKSLLRLASVIVYPNSYKTEVIDVAITNTNMEELSYLKTRVDNMEYNLALTDLDREALDKEPANYLRGILTDNFIGYTKVDMSHPSIDFSMDLEKGGELTLPYTQKTYELSKANTSTVKETKRFYIAPYSEVVSLDQPLVSSTMLVNPYLSIPKSPVVNLSPDTDSWIETLEKTVQGGDKVSVTTSRSWWRKRGEQWIARESNTWEDIKHDTNKFTLSTSSTTKDTTSIQRSTEVTTNIQDSEILYMRQREVMFSAENFIPFEDNIEGWFDGKKLALTGTNGTLNGIQVGTLKAKADGTLSGKFTIPKGVICGTREFSLVPTSNNQPSAIAYYSANGRKRDITKTVFNIIKKNVHTDTYTTETLTGIVTPRRERWGGSDRDDRRSDRDPLAQTFEFDRDRILTSIELYFHTKDPMLPVIVQVRDVVNGYPGTSIYAEKIVKPSEINISMDSSVPTKITFDDPVYCDANTQFCFVVITESKLPRVYIAKLGEQELGKTSKISTQPYISGVLFSGSNTKTWTAHQDCDLKFKLYCASFSSSSILEFNELTGLQADRFMFLADYFTPKNTSIAWEYSLDGGNWQPTADYSDKEFSRITNNIKLRAKIFSTQDVSPTLSKNSFESVAFRNKLKTSYISRNVYHEQGYNTILQEIDYYAPEGSNILVTYATDTNGNTWTSLPTSSSRDLGEGWKRLTLTGTVGNQKNFRAKIELTTSSPTIRPRVRQILNVLSRK